VSSKQPKEEEEEEELPAEYDDGKLTLGDLFTSIDRSKLQTSTKQQDDVINTNRLQKQLKSLRKEA